MGGTAMSLHNAFLRAYIALSHYEAKVLTPVEKEKACQQMIANNRQQDRDVHHAEKKLLEGLLVQEVALPHCGAWLFTKEGNPTDKVIYYIHGGGFTGACTKDRMLFVSTMVKSLGYNVFSIDYRLAPEFKQPCALNDCLDGYSYLLATYQSGHIVYVGESAGGTLSLALAMLVRDKSLPSCKAIYANSPATQLVEITDSYRRFSLKEDFVVNSTIIPNMEGVYYESKDAKDPYVSPLYGNLKGLPSITLTASQCECLFDDSVMMYGALKVAGNDCHFMSYPGLWHAFIMSPQKHQIVKEAYPDFKAFLKTNLQ
jgi:monoterpene epsilon-lactone hydrolase